MFEGEVVVSLAIADYLVVLVWSFHLSAAGMTCLYLFYPLGMAIATNSFEFMHHFY